MTPTILFVDFSCWDIIAPRAGEPYDYSPKDIFVEIDTNDPDVKFNQHEQVQILSTIERVMGETDRKVYKMGDTVKVRFLAYDFDMKPLKNRQVIILSSFVLFSK